MSKCNSFLLPPDLKLPSSITSTNILTKNISDRYLPRGVELSFILGRSPLLSTLQSGRLQATFNQVKIKHRVKVYVFVDSAVVSPDWNDTGVNKGHMAVFTYSSLTNSWWRTDKFQTFLPFPCYFCETTKYFQYLIVSSFNCSNSGKHQNDQKPNCNYNPSVYFCIDQILRLHLRGSPKLQGQHPALHAVSWKA